MTVTDYADVDALLDALDEPTLLKQHAALDALRAPSEAAVHAHHAICREMTKRGLPHGHDDDALAKVKVLVEEDPAFPVSLAHTLDDVTKAAVEEVAKAHGSDTVSLSTLLTVDGYELVVKHPGHSPQSVHGRRGASGGVSEATGMSILDKVRENGGLTIRANGKEPLTGYIVAVRGHNKEIPEADFFDPVKGPQAIASWAKAKRAEFKAEPGAPGRYMGVWHDKKNGEVVLDVVEQHRNKAAAVAAGRDRNQQSIWDVKNFAEIDTGGTGDRADKSAARADRGAGLHDHDGRGDRRLEPQGVGVLGGRDGAAGRVAKYNPYRDSIGRFASGPGGTMTARDMMDVEDVVGPERVDEVTGGKGLSGATDAEMRILTAEARAIEAERSPNPRRGREITARDMMDAEDIIGPERVDEITGGKGLSGATPAEVRRIMAEAGMEEFAKRQYVRDSHGRFAATGSGGRIRSSERHGSGMLSATDVAEIERILPKRSIRMEYSESYASGIAARETAGAEATLSRRHGDMMADMAWLHASGQGHGDMETETRAMNVVSHAGYIDGAMGVKRKWRRPLFGVTPYAVESAALGRIPEAFGKSVEDWDALPEFAKRQYVRDSHGRFAEVAGRGVPGLGPTDKPDIIEITDPFGDSIRLTKADSLYHHMERKADGSWGLTAEREEFHRQIVGEALAGVPRAEGQPTMYMLGGGPAAGKTTMLNKGGLTVPTTGENGSARKAVLVNADEVKVRLPEYTAMGAKGAGFTHEESSLVAKRIQEAAIVGGRDVVLDGTGDSKPQKLAAKIQQARDAGYRVEGHYATVPTAMAVQRAHDRGVRTGRVVPESVVRGTHADVSRTFPQAHHLFDSVSVYDTTNGARRIAEGSYGSPLTILDAPAYAAFLAKGNE